MAQFAKGNPGGPGRPKKTDKYRGKIERAEKQIADRLPDLIENMFRLATGVMIEEVNPLTGEKDIYQKPPDYKANEYLINRIMGKPTERQEIEYPEGIDVKVIADEQQLSDYLAARTAAETARRRYTGDAGRTGDELADNLP